MESLAKTFRVLLRGVIAKSYGQQVLQCGAVNITLSSAATYFLKELLCNRPCYLLLPVQFLDLIFHICPELLEMLFSHERRQLGLKLPMNIPKSPLERQICQQG